MANAIVNFIKKNLESLTSENNSEYNRIFKCESQGGAQVMLHVDLSGDIILTVEDETREYGVQSWILKETI
jgi:hypothetical protein